MSLQKKISSMLVCMALFFFSAGAQGDNPLGKITYVQMVAAKADSGKSEKQYNNKEMNLYFGKTASVYQQLPGKPAMHIRTADGQLADSALAKKAMAELEKRMPGLENRPRAGLTIYRQYDRPALMLQQTYNGERYLMTDEPPAIAWQITEESMVIGGYNCRKATGKFRGRIYEAWFTPDIPVMAGPWKLAGLPGLVLEAADTDKDVLFRFQSIQIPNPDAALLILPPQEGKQVTMEVYQAEVNKNLERLENMLRASGGNVNVNRQEQAPMERKDHRQ